MLQERVADKGNEGPQHVHGTVGEVDDIQQAEYHRQTQAQHGVKHTHVQPKQRLGQYDLH